MSLPLKVDKVFFSYGNRPILQGVDLEIGPGDMLGLVGPNGAGKTTLLRTITGTLRPERGRVLIGSIDVASLRPRDRALRVAMVPQSPVAPQGFTALDVVLMGRNPHLGFLQWEGPHDLEVAHQMMEVTGTLSFAHRPINTLSGGERQRVFIARALVQQAPLLVLDEPTAHLDLGFQPLVLDLLQHIGETLGVSVLAAMHDLTLTAQYCPNIAVLHQGSIFALGEPRQVVTQDLVKTVFGAEVCVLHHPLSGTPVVVPMPRTSQPYRHIPDKVPSSLMGIRKVKEHHAYLLPDPQRHRDPLRPGPG